jgi:chaperonin cofactor prefoldin
MFIYMESLGSITLAASGLKMKVAAVVVIAILGASFGSYFYYTSAYEIPSLNHIILSQSTKISSLNQTVSSQASQLASQAQQIASDNAKISNDTSEINNLTSTISSLQSKIAALNGQLISDQSKITQLQSLISAYQSQIATLQNQIASLQIQVSSLEAIAGLTETTIETPTSSFSTGDNGLVQIAGFTADYAGYVSVTVSSASDPTNEGLQVLIEFAPSVSSSYSGIYIPGSQNFYPFSSSSETDVIPVVPGTVLVYLATSDITSQTATLSVTYYY